MKPRICLPKWKGSIHLSPNLLKKLLFYNPYMMIFYAGSSINTIKSDCHHISCLLILSITTFEKTMTNPVIMVWKRKIVQEIMFAPSIANHMILEGSPSGHWPVFKLFENIVALKHSFQESEIFYIIIYPNLVVAWVITEWFACFW